MKINYCVICVLSKSSESKFPLHLTDINIICISSSVNAKEKAAITNLDEPPVVLPAAHLNLKCLIKSLGCKNL